MRKIKYAQAINEAFVQMMGNYDDVFVIGQGLDSPWSVGSTMVGLIEKFGSNRVIDTPIAENAITGIAVGSALSGMRPVLIHPRMDFMYLAMDQIINSAAKWYYMFGGKISVPITIRAIVNRGAGQGAQHSQTNQAMFMHVPGLKIVMPATGYDAKGLLVASILDDNPVIYIDDRWLYDIEDNVPEDAYMVPIGKGAIRKEGKDVTLVATSYMVLESVKAIEILDNEGIDVELIDLRSLKPLDEDLLFESVKKTGRLVIADGTWKTCGVAAEISALVVENIFEYIKAPIMRVTLPDTPAPASYVLEKVYYPDTHNIIMAVKSTINWRQ